MTNIDLKPLLDNLRNATEFWNAVKESGPNQDTIADGSFSDAREWLTAAALDLGRALVAQREAVTQEDSVDGRPRAIECPACGEQELMPGDLCACGYETDPAAGYACSECDGSGDGCVGEVCRECDGTGWFVRPTAQDDGGDHE
ncbi:TPA: hypothetical protein ACP31N_003616 [Pseudomonas aeruginosa]